MSWGSSLDTFMRARAAEYRGVVGAFVGVGLDYDFNCRTRLEAKLPAV
jgi:hypothetical protein